jgi:sugar-specific transcriptional regulator TrmB
MFKENKTVNLTTSNVVDSEKHELEHIQQELMKFGLSKQQAEIYVLLVIYQELRIQDIAHLAGIPRSSVYENLKKLFEVGIAEEVIESSFKKIRPYSLVSIKNGLNDRLLNLQKLSRDIEELEKNIKITKQINSKTDSEVRFYRGRSGARQLYWNSLKAQNTVYVYSDFSRVRYVGTGFYENFVVESVKRKIKEKVLVNLSEDILISIKNHNIPKSSIARTRMEDLRIIDEKIIPIQGDTLIYDTVYSQVYLNNINIHGFEIENNHFANSQRSIFETLWEMATPATAFIHD